MPGYGTILKKNAPHLKDVFFLCFHPGLFQCLYFCQNAS
nr:MAG TPA: hypothetical protein [Caudoviricetes sp.]